MTNQRRCNSDGCQLIASTKSARMTIDLPIANILSSPARDWKNLTQGNRKVARTINLDWNKINQDDHIYTHCSIVASVNTTENGYYIESPTDELVNSNGNAWSTPVLLSTFKTFIGADNFLEHVQIKELSKGRILDAIARPVLYKGKNGKEASVIYVDILVSTDRKHNELVEDIVTGKLTTLSMGGIAHVVQCSKCGKELRNDENCPHLDNDLLTYFNDENGVRRIVAELCGRSTVDQTTGVRIGDPESFEFIEASWVENPAFKGAVLNHMVSDLNEDKKYANILSASSMWLDDFYQDLNKMKVADSNGRLVLKLARQELMRRKKEAGLIERVSIWHSENYK